MKQIPETEILIDDIALDVENPNVMTKEQLEGLDKIMDIANVTDLVVNKAKTGEKKYKLIDGHQRIFVYNQHRHKKVFAKVIDVPEPEAKLLQQALNKLRGTHDKEKDAKIFKLLYDEGMLPLLSTVTAIPEDTFKLQLDKYFELGIADQEDPIPSVPKSTKTKDGDLYQLGRHRLLCGDCTTKEHTEKLFAGKSADQIVTDPPYGVDYQSKNELLKQYGKGTHIQFDFANEDRKEYRSFYGAFLHYAKLNPINTIYIFSGGMRLHEVRMAMEDEGVTWGDYLCWVKNGQVFGRKDYNAKHENIVYGWKGKHKFYGGYQTTVIEEDKPHVSDLHPTTKPIKLVSRLILHGSQKGDIVYDPFGGSGTTLICCENEGRTCYMIEKIPHFIDVIVKRWEEHTKKKAMKL